MLKIQDAIIAVLLLGFAGFFAYEISKISAADFQRAPGIIYYPLLLSVSLGVASLLLLAKTLVWPLGVRETEQERESEEGATPAVGEGVGDEPENESQERAEGASDTRTPGVGILPVLLGITILVAYVFALGLVGFIFSTPVMLVALLLSYGVRNWKVIGALSLGITAFIYVVFYYLLAVQLP